MEGKARRVGEDKRKGAREQHHTRDERIRGGAQNGDQKMADGGSPRKKYTRPPVDI